MAVKRIKVNGRWVWQARVQVGGQRRSAIRENKAAARDAEADLLQQLREEARRASAGEARPVTVREAFEAYVEDLDARGKSPDSIGRAVETAKAFERMLPAVLDRAVSDLSDAELTDTIFAFRKARDRAGAKPSTINRDLRTLRAMLKQVRPDYRCPSGAFFREDEGRVRWLRPDEEITVLESMRAPFREMAKLAALAIMRLSEVRLLRREQVHLELGVLLLPRTKTGPVQVILSEPAQAILRRQLARHPASEWVFPNPDGVPYSRVHVSRAFRKAARSAGLKDFTFHDLKHHGATMAASRWPDRVVQKLGRWKSPRMVERYAAVTDATLRAAAETVAGSVDDASRAPQSGNGRWQRRRKPASNRGRYGPSQG